MARRLAFLTAVVVALALMCGCGGGGVDATGGNGSLRLRMTFPPLPEVAPQYVSPNLMSIIVTVQDADTLQDKVPPGTVNRPDASGGTVNITIDDVHVGPTRVAVRGYAQLDGAGPIISHAAAEVEVEANQTALVGLTMATTVVRTVISGPASVLVGGTAQLTATGYDIDDNVVLDAVFDWQASHAGATVDGAGLVTGVTAGQVDISATEQGGQADPAVWPMDVNPSIDLVTVEPSKVTINIGLTADILARAWTDGGTVEAPGAPLTFGSDDESVATVTKLTDNTARINAVAGGAAIITVSQPYTGVVGTCAVTVTTRGSVGVIIN